MPAAYTARQLQTLVEDQGEGNRGWKRANGPWLSSFLPWGRGFGAALSGAPTQFLQPLGSRQTGGCWETLVGVGTYRGGGW